MGSKEPRRHQSSEECDCKDLQPNWVLKDNQCQRDSKDTLRDLDAHLRVHAGRPEGCRWGLTWLVLSPGGGFCLSRGDVGALLWLNHSSPPATGREGGAVSQHRADMQVPV